MTVRAVWAPGIAALAFLVSACGGGDSVELSAAGERGRAIADRSGCTACHGGAGDDATVGPSWIGSWGTDVGLDDGATIAFDEAYVVASVRTPERARRDGDWLTMPAFGDDQVSDDELADLVAYLRDLGDAP